ncbi:hypothetical protein DL764_009954 [Monosporascus ibericus]|uniref:Uncharacterized protein n=1 Tax=Monosporascus ibericus TaxID=155417 RepID=A0A4Q4SW03_9PEZI|nr:hypothetical protein DL764_009954 [Monosporascus ibericus]
MHLLRRSDHGDFSLVKDDLGFGKDFIGGDIPRYSILSHTWDAEEVSFKDMMNGTSTRRRGYDKIRFCGEQAERDGLKFF